MNTEQGTTQGNAQGKGLITEGDTNLELLHMAKADFIVLAMPRSGSTWLTNLLNTHPYILANHCPSWNTTEVVSCEHASMNSAVQDCTEEGLPRYEGLYGVVSTIAWSPAALQYIRNTNKPVIILGNSVDATVRSCLACEDRRGTSTARQVIEDVVISMVESRLNIHKYRKENNLPTKVVLKSDLFHTSKPKHAVDVLTYLLKVFQGHDEFKNLLPLPAPTYYKALQAYDFNITTKLY